MSRTKLYFIGGILFTAILGTLSHFFYDWTGRGALIGLVSPVNESTWEHMKLVFFPLLLWTLLASPGLSGEYPAISGALLLGNILGTLSIPVLFYTYTGILGRDVFPLDIAVFLAAVLISFRFAWKKKDSRGILQYQALIWIFTGIFVVLFFVFTFYPSGIGLFQDQSSTSLSILSSASC